ncbi:ribosome small subunit-dependent GTPase A [Ilumatobacter nonamiensis]|uniref:ribosome small subunit-dependent GTPase A n=1 Tax=Ilumatobacter nonamiensis TaxID=467093 RepID=UPI000688C570|nr:ribosome small subunit-dependent GTPase A [Ilumatobacter nonamiensis]
MNDVDDGRDRLGWSASFEQAWTDLGRPGEPARVTRLDRGWSTAARSLNQVVGREEPVRLRNIGADVAVGDWIVPSDDGERVEHVLDRTSAFTRRASFDGMRAVAHTLAANIDVVFLIHALGAPPSPRRLERELVLAFDSGAEPIVVLTKTDLVDDPEPTRLALAAVALGVPVLLASGITGEGVDALRAAASGNRTLAFLGASGVGKSTLVNALVGDAVQATSEVREGDQRGRHTTVVASLVPMPDEGWMIDTPGVRAVSLWLSGDGIERAFADVFDLMDHCRFRDCKHDREPGCAVQQAIADGDLDPVRLSALEALIVEESALEEEQRAREKAADRRSKDQRRPEVAEFDGMRE